MSYSDEPCAGRIYGVTFVDHSNGIVANSSVLGNLYSANGFNVLYGQAQETFIQLLRQPEIRSWQENYPLSHPV